MDPGLGRVPLKGRCWWGCSQVNIILLPDPLSHQLALADAQSLLAAHRLTFPVLGHLDGEGGVHDAIATQHLTCRKKLCMKQTVPSALQMLSDKLSNDDMWNLVCAAFGSVTHLFNSRR